MSLLDRSPEMVRADSERQAELRAEAIASGRVPTSKSARALDFLDRAIADTRKQIKARRGAPRRALEARLAHQLQERERLST